MKFTGHFTGAKLDLKAYRRRLETHLRDELQRVTRAWLHAVTGRVPVWSGMARASLLNVAVEIGGSIVISPVAKSRISLGQPLGLVKTNYESTSSTIEISTSVPHYILQEYTDVGISKSAPWRSFEAGASAYYVAARSATLPPLIFKPKRYNV